jgi:hypothetical protein
MTQAWADHLDRLRADCATQMASVSAVLQTDFQGESDKTTTPQSKNNSQMSVSYSLVLNRPKLYDLV